MYGCTYLTVVTIATLGAIGGSCDLIHMYQCVRVTGLNVRCVCVTGMCHKDSNLKRDTLVYKQP